VALEDSRSDKERKIGPAAKGRIASLTLRARDLNRVAVRGGDMISREKYDPRRGRQRAERHRIPARSGYRKGQQNRIDPEYGCFPVPPGHRNTLKVRRTRSMKSPDPASINMPGDNPNFPNNWTSIGPGAIMNRRRSGTPCGAKSASGSSIPVFRRRCEKWSNISCPRLLSSSSGLIGRIPGAQHRACHMGPP